jgi:nucleoside-diphosphate-sugar epimerase
VKVLVTGATGFVGQALIENLLFETYEVRALVRDSFSALPLGVEQVVMGDLIDLISSDPTIALRDAFKGVDTVVHTAARAHIMNDKVSNPLDEFRKVNLDATLVLARLSAEFGVKRFIFLSSIKVNGEMTKHRKAFTPDDVYIPDDPYGLSKYEAEQGLLSMAQETDMEVVIIRPPLVYGPRVKGNFASIMRWMSLPLPLPFGAINNQRSLVALDNLISFISLCIDRKKSLKASNQIFLISDGEDVSTTQLLKKVRQAIKLQSLSGIKACLVPFPVFIMAFFADMLGKRDLANRLFGSLQVDMSKNYDLLGWTPVVTMEEQLAKIFKKI